jgi:hypothetical protein
MKFPNTSACQEPVGFVERHSNEGMISDDSGEPASPSQLSGGPLPDQPIRYPVDVVQSDGSQNKVHFVIDDIKRMSHESRAEIQHLLGTPLHVTTQRYLDNLADSNLKNHISRQIKLKFDIIIRDIGVFMLLQDPHIPETECEWHSFDEVLHAGSIPDDMPAQIHGLSKNTVLNGQLGRILGPASNKRGNYRRWQFMLDVPDLAQGRYSCGIEVLPVNVRLMTTDKRASDVRAAMWLYALDEVRTPAELFIKLLEHYHVYAPCFEGSKDFHFKRPFIQQLVDIFGPWEEAASYARYADLACR